MTNITIPELLPASCHSPAGEVSADSDTAVPELAGIPSGGAGLLSRAEDIAEALMDCGHRVVFAPEPPNTRAPRRPFTKAEIDAFVRLFIKPAAPQDEPPVPPRAA